MKDNIIYELHVRGFTRHSSSGVHNPNLCGSYGKNPLSERTGNQCGGADADFEFDENERLQRVNGRKLLDYWGYNPVCFCAEYQLYCPDRIQSGRAGAEKTHKGPE